MIEQRIAIEQQINILIILKRWLEAIKKISKEAETVEKELEKSGGILP